MIPIQNIYYMLAYAFRVLNAQGYQSVSTEAFDNVADLCAAILIKGTTIQLKRGLHKDYIPQTEPLSSPRGKIEINESLRTQAIWKRQLVCSYDVFSENAYLNRILKTTLFLLLKADVAKERKKQIHRLLPFFESVDTLEIADIDWHLRYDRNNQHYRMLISICHLVIKGLLQTQANGDTKLMSFLDEQRMSHLYEKFILEYYAKHFPKLTVTASQIPWALDDDFGFMLPVMQSDIHLQRGNNVLIIDAKYYSHTTQTQYDKHTLHSGNLYQIFTYVKNRHYQFGEAPHQVSGMLLYARTDEAIQPDQVFQMHGNKISVKNLDLNCQFSCIAEQLNRIAADHFGDTVFMQ